VFNGSRFRAEIAPRIADFVLSMSHGNPSRPRSSAAGSSTDAERAKIKA
jgi:hypothetical protein